MTIDIYSETIYNKIQCVDSTHISLNTIHEMRDGKLSSHYDLLVISAVRLFDLGMDLEGMRKKLLQLVEDGVPYESAEMLAALEDFQTMDAQWKSLEKEHLALRDELLHRNGSALD